MSRNSGQKEVFRVVSQSIGAEPTCCSMECNRSGGLLVVIYGPMSGGSVLPHFGSPDFASRVAKAFTNFLQGMFYLVCTPGGGRLPATLGFLREFGKAMFAHWLLAERATGAKPAAAPDGLIDVWVQVARETPGLAKLTGGVLTTIWNRMRDQILAELTTRRTTLNDVMTGISQDWARVGMVSLRLDVLVPEAIRPFMLVTSYYDSATTAVCGVGTPIAVPVFGEGRVHGLRNHVKDLLRRAGACNAVLRRLFESQEIYGPCHLIPRDAHSIVRDIPALETLGIEVRLPHWWKDIKQPEIRVRTRIGTGAPKPVGLGALLDLRTAYVVGDHELTEAEWRELVRGDHAGLTRIGDKWVDLVPSRVDDADRAGKQVRELHAQGGVSYSTALELVGMRTPGQVPVAAVTLPPAAVFEPGQWLDTAWSAIERRDFRPDAAPGVRLRGELFGYQRQGIAWLSTLMDARVGACLADDMGLGKTLQVIALLVALLRRQDPGPHLIIVPASLMTNWQREFERFAPTVDIRVMHGGDAELGDPVSYVTIASYGTVLRNKTIQGRRWGLVALDEAQEIKNPRAQISQAVKRLSARARLCLSGTPIENHLLDIWSIMDFLNPGLLGTEPEFRAWCREHLTDTDVTSLRQRVSPFILRRLKTDPVIALDLPQKVEVTVFCGMTTPQSDLYGRIYANMLAQFAAADSAGRRGIVFKVLLRLKQICDHPDLIEGGRFDPRLSGKFLRLAEIAATIAERGEKVLVFTQFKEMTRPIAAHLEAVTRRSGEILDGDLPVKRRQEIVEEFQSGGRLSFLVLTFGVGGTGFNLTAACHVVLFDRWWNPAVENQAMDRVFRIGQTKGVVVHKFVCRGTLEERIDQLIQHKHELAKGLFASDSGSDGGLERLSPDELLSLAALDPSLSSIDER